ncbi:MAG: lytic transglycosylase domain-containing protein [Nanoarchaeota archaeon]|nr:lytic transglycosylase domain-containing protein [Nanoarchaeota archaeon]
MKNKKLLLALSALLLVGTAKPFSTHAPALNEPMRKVYREGGKRHLRFIDVPESIAESIVLPKPIGLIERLRDMENQEFAKDEIYQIIDSLYESKGIKHPYINKEFVRAIVYAESMNSLTGRENPRAISKAGARGHMQIMKDTWELVDKSNYYQNAFTPLKNIEVGIKILMGLDGTCNDIYPGWEKLNDNQRKKIILVGYNWGLGNFRTLGKWNWNKLPEETEKYVRDVEKKEGEYYKRKKAFYTKNHGLVLKLY